MELKFYNRVKSKPSYFFNILFLLFFSHTPTLEAQTLNRNKGTVGYACYFGGQPSTSVRKMSKLIEKSEYRTIVELLGKGNTAEKYLAALVC